MRRAVKVEPRATDPWRCLIAQIVCPVVPASHAAEVRKTEYEQLRAAMRNLYQRNKSLREKLSALERDSPNYLRAKAKLMLNTARLAELKQQSAELGA